MTLRFRLAIGLTAIAIALIIPLLIALNSLEELNESTRDFRQDEFAASLLLGRIRTTNTQLREAETGVVFSVDSARPPFEEAMSAAIARLSELADSLEMHQLDTAARNVRIAIREVAEYAPLQLRLARSGGSREAEPISLERMVPAMNRIDGSTGLAERSLSQRMVARVEATAARAEAAKRLSAFLLVVAGTIAAFISIWLIRSISRPVSDLEHGMQRVADGDFNHRLTVAPDRRDEFGRLAQSYQEMSRQLAELDKLKAEFVSVASHELKTPINVVLGYLQLLDEGVYGELNPKQRETIATLEAQTKSLGRLVKQLLDVSRFEAGGGKLEPREIELSHFLSELESTFYVLARQREVTFLVTHGANLPSVVLWDPDRMNEVLGNLISNAFKFTDRGGTVEVSAQTQDGKVCLRVRDTGAGIPPEQLPHVFRKFYQADNQGMAAHAGTGLGLAIAKEIVEAHSGTITVDSSPGVGTTFEIMLPHRVEGRRSSTQRAIPEGVKA
jgi:signal transduction histidine kinase